MDWLGLLVVVLGRQGAWDWERGVWLCFVRYPGPPFSVAIRAEAPLTSWRSNQLGGNLMHNLWRELWLLGFWRFFIANSLGMCFFEHLRCDTITCKKENYPKSIMAASGSGAQGGSSRWQNAVLQAQFYK